jgi:hypothetical protein
VAATFDTGHVDCEPIGDVASTVVALIQGNPDLSLTYEHVTGGGETRLSTDEMREVPDRYAAQRPEVLAWAREFLEEGE